MPPKKRQREVPLIEASSTADGRSSKQAAEQKRAALRGPVIVLLPQEIINMIVELGMALTPASAEPMVAAKSLMGFMRASRRLYERVSPLLYPRLFESVVVARPSKLASLHEVLATKPWLRPLIKSVEIRDVKGPNGFESRKWPIDLPKVAWSRGLRDYRIEHGVKRHAWLAAPDLWSPLNNAYRCRDRFVLDAVEAAEEAVGVDLSRPPQDAWAYRGGWLKFDRYIIDCVRIQACLDLYLLEMRRVEDKDGCGFDPHCGPGRCSHFRRLRVVGATTQGPSRSRAFFKISHADIDAHLSRKGADTDCFSHWLLLARSRRRLWYYNEQRQRVDLANGPWLVRKNDPQALALDSTTYNGNVGLIRSLLVMTKGARVEFSCGECLANSVEVGWHRRLVPVEEQGVVWQGSRARRLAEEEEGEEEESSKEAQSQPQQRLPMYTSLIEG